mgnify:CR=1 FL=1
MRNVRLFVLLAVFLAVPASLSAQGVPFMSGGIGKSGNRGDQEAALRPTATVARKAAQASIDHAVTELIIENIRADHAAFHIVRVDGPLIEAACEVDRYRSRGPGGSSSSRLRSSSGRSRLPSSRISTSSPFNRVTPMDVAFNRSMSSCCSSSRSILAG